MHRGLLLLLVCVMLGACVGLGGTGEETVPASEYENVSERVDELEADLARTQADLAAAEADLESVERDLTEAEALIETEELRVIDPVTERERTVDIEELERLIHHAVNAEREAEDVDELAFDDELAAIARNHSSDMDARSFFDHENPDGDGPVDRIADAGYECEFRHGGYIYSGGENLVLGYFRRQAGTPWNETRVDHDEQDLANTTIDLWMDSDAHRENLLNEAWRNQGIGVHYNSSSRAVYVTQKFC